MYLMSIRFYITTGSTLYYVCCAHYNGSFKESISHLLELHAGKLILIFINQLLSSAIT